ncbi:Retrovirus-related Pol polyprotein from transposon TNT 1-94 [Senna tora]|uniref:Retrovirus-related Pol polyprotein from transposon TNT 1-94 n=1 Tax=Senna tora TaxID=362788 RepID=A0A834SUV0_9FABA|nr:Retrovirus-related Pol polyprotein from transposon TNT 1-94 [Senna tora]
MHVPAVKRSKLDQKAKQGIFLGYAEFSKGYRVYNLQTQKVSVSRDVLVDEDSYWNWEKGSVDKDDSWKRSSSLPTPQEEDLAAEFDEIKSDDSSKDSLVLKTKSLFEIYERWVLSRYLKEPGQVHLDAAKRVLRYFEGTADFGLCWEY